MLLDSTIWDERPLQEGPLQALPADAAAALLRSRRPSPESAAQLGALAPEGLSQRGRIDALAALERHVAWLQAAQVRLLADIAEETDGASDDGDDGDAGGDGSDGWATEEVACALRLANSTASDRLHQAALLTARHPLTLGLLESGRVSYQQARAMAELCQVLSPAVAGEVEWMLADRLPEQSAGQTRQAVRKAILKADPEGAEERHRTRCRDRETLHYAQDDGMAVFGAYLPAEQAALMEQAVDAHAATYTDTGRTLPQKRADALYDLIANHPCRTASSPQDTTMARPETRVLVQVTIPFDTLINWDDGPADLKGYGPIAASQARQLAFAPGTIWRRLLTHPTTGLLIKTDPTTYKPTAETARQVMARDGECAFPSCRMPAARCDLDHVIPFNHTDPARGGATSPDNLQPLCRRHHRLKTEHTGWQVTRNTATGTTTWEAPTGHTYTNTPRIYRE
ncbi:DUF222 domain-containing protein [Streptomyces sp. NPDC050095]|uniref:HNH endonuclease signature motif containing protein n=1 Tax=unclassified Streptomyces TaxID=2593676 RepID=UPI00343B61A6